ncbi:MAG: NAD+ synthase, partial [Planctomycetes bacterium]|nr:NAD+ synthase [Planctomycetota bacterium]
MRVALAQTDPTVADIDGNAARVVARIQSARQAGAQLVVTTELAVFGYPPKDIDVRDDLIRRNVAALEEIATHCTDITAVVGFAKPNPSGVGKGVLNAAAVCRNGAVEATYAKMLPPTYDVFDESRYFEPGRTPLVFTIGGEQDGQRVGITICE